MTFQEIRHTLRAIKLNKMDPATSIDILVSTMENLAIRNELLAHKHDQLFQTLIAMKKRTKKGKPMGLVDPEHPGQAQFSHQQKLHVHERLKRKRWHKQSKK